MVCRSGLSGLCVVLVLCCAGAGEAASTAELVRDLSGADAAAEFRASRALVAQGDAAVPALERLAGSEGPLAPRLVAVELLGEIGTQKARDALLGLLENERKDLAVRGQLCMQLGYLREKRAVPVIAKWLDTIGPRNFDDVPGPKEVQPSTCYVRQVEALGMIGDESAVAVLEAFDRKVPANVGYGGWLTAMTHGAVKNAIEDIRDETAFRNAVRKHPGLEQTITPLLDHLRTSRVATFHQHAGEVFRLTSEGKAVLRALTTHPDAAVAKGAKALLEKYGSLTP